MSRELCHQQEALWELLTTELIYVQKLKIMTNVSLPQSQPWPHPQPYTILPQSSQTRGTGSLGEGGRGKIPRDPPDLRPSQDLGREVSSTEVGVVIH